MTDLLHAIDRAVLARMLAWARDVPGLAATFREDHAAYGLYCTTGYLGDAITMTPEARFTFALDHAYWWWFDDLIDEHIGEPHSVVAWDALARTLPTLTRGHPRVVAGEAVEIGYLRALSADLWATAPRDDDHAWWVHSALGTCLGFRDEETATRARTPVSYAEQLHAGTWSAVLTNVVATMSTLLRLGFGDRKPFEPTTAERALCLAARIENDRHSLAKERAEGCASNVGEILTRAFPSLGLDAILAFMESEQRGYERVLETELARLGDAHPFTLLARGIIATHRGFYAARPDRYAT